jgi:DNA-binding GntR family transcriptional regulator
MAAETAWTGRPLTTQEQILLEIRRRILTGDLQPGKPIRPDQIAAELGVSRVPVREALKILEGEGQVEYRPHHGYFLAELRLFDLVEIYAIRRLLEEEAAKAAVVNLGPEHLAAMNGAISQMEEAGPDDVAAMAVANRRFHFTLLEAANMPHLQRLIRLLWDASDHYRAAYYLDPANRRQVRAEHRRILDAAKDKDAAALIEAMEEHRRHAIEGLSKILQAQPGEED